MRPLFCEAGEEGMRKMARLLIAVMPVQIRIVVSGPKRMRRDRKRKGQVEPTMFLEDRTIPYANARFLTLKCSPSDNVMGE